MPRRAATERGLSTRFSASKVARTMLYGLAVPCDLATMSLIPRVSNTRTHRTAGNDAGAGRGCTKHDLAGAVAAVDVVMQRPRFAKRHADHLTLGLFGRLANGFGNLTGLAVAKANAAFLVADHNERGETEALTALDHLGHAVDVDQAIDEFAFALSYISHRSLSLIIRTATRLRGQHRPGLSPGHGKGRSRGRKPLRPRQP